MEHPQIAPYAESYAPAEPEFKFTPSQREKDFAQLVASGAAPIEALSACGIISEDEAITSPRSSLYRMATRLLSSEAVQERIDYYRALHNHNLSVTADRLRQELAAISFADFAEAFDPGTGQPITKPRDIPRHLRAAVKEWYVDKDGVTRFKLHDKLKAMQMVGDLEGHFDEANRTKAPQVTVNLAHQTNVHPDTTISPEGDSPQDVENFSHRDALVGFSPPLPASCSSNNGNVEAGESSSGEADGNHDKDSDAELPECLR